MLTMMLLKRRKSLGLGDTEVLCYAFAPPPVFGPLHKLSGETRRAIRSFVFGNDMVCRLSLASAYGLFSDLNEVDGIGVSAWGGSGANSALRTRAIACAWDDSQCHLFRGLEETLVVFFSSGGGVPSQGRPCSALSLRRVWR